MKKLVFYSVVLLGVIACTLQYPCRSYMQYQAKGSLCSIEKCQRKIYIQKKGTLAINRLTEMEKQIQMGLIALFQNKGWTVLRAKEYNAYVLEWDLNIQELNKNAYLGACSAAEGKGKLALCASNTGDCVYNGVASHKVPEITFKIGKYQQDCTIGKSVYAAKMNVLNYPAPTNELFIQVFEWVFGSHVNDGYTPKIDIICRHRTHDFDDTEDIECRTDIKENTLFKIKQYFNSTETKAFGS